MFPSLISSLFFHTIIFDQNGNKIIHPPCFHCDNSLILRQFSARFNGIVDSIAEKGADVQRLYEIYIAKINKSREIDLLFPGFFRLISDNDIKEIISGMDVIFIVRDLRAQLLRHPAGNFCSLTAFKYKEMIFHIMIDCPHPLLIF